MDYITIYDDAFGTEVHDMAARPAVVGEEVQVVSGHFESGGGIGEPEPHESAD